MEESAIKLPLILCSGAVSAQKVDQYAEFRDLGALSRGPVIASLAGESLEAEKRFSIPDESVIEVLVDPNVVS